MPDTYTITTPRGDQVDIQAPDQQTAIKAAQQWDMQDHATSEANRLGVDPALALGVMHQESRSNPTAVSPRGALGPMQLMPDTAKELGVDPTDPYQNITGGITYLKQQLDAFGGDKAKALAAYNAGPGNVQKYGGIPPFPETQAYVNSILGGGQAASVAAAPVPPVPPAAPMAPDAAPPPHPAAPTSFRLGLEQGGGQPFAKLDEIAGGIGNRLGLTAPDWLKTAAHNLQAGQSAIDAQHYAPGTQPSKLGQFVGNVATTSPIPGGPLVNGAMTGALLSNSDDPMGIAGDAVKGAIFNKLGSSVVSGVGHLMSGVTDPAVRMLADKGVPLTIGQLAGGLTHNIEDKLTSVPIVGDMIRNAQRQGLAGAQRAAWNDTLAPIGDALPQGVALGHEAYSYAKKSLGDAYDAVLQPLTVQKDPTFTAALNAAKAEIKKIGDPNISNTALSAIKSSVESRFDKTGQMAGEALKDAQSDLGSHINDLRTVVGAGGTWSRKAADALSGVKSAVEDLVSRTSPAAGQALGQINSAYSLFKPMENAAKAAAVKDGGQFTLNQFAQGVAKGRGASTLAAGNAPHQALATAASRVLPSTVPDSGTAGRSAMTMLLGGLLAGHGLPVVGPATLPITGLIGSGAALYSKTGQKALTVAATARNDIARQVGHYIDMLSAPAGTATTALLAGH